MATSTRDIFYIAARAASASLPLMAYFTMVSVPHYNLYKSFLSLAAISPIPALWNCAWSVINAGAICMGLEPLDTSHLFLVLAEWVITGLTTVPAWLAFGVVVFFDIDRCSCGPESWLWEVCRNVEVAAGLYMFAGTINLAIALVKSAQLARRYPIYRLPE